MNCRSSIRIFGARIGKTEKRARDLRGSRRRTSIARRAGGFGVGCHVTTTSLYTIALARLRDLSALPAIELAAARLLVGQAPESVLTETTSHEELRDAQRLGHLWVALLDDQPLGFAHVKILETGHA